MKKRISKSIALMLVALMFLSSMPYIGIGLISFAEDEFNQVEDLLDTDCRTDTDYRTETDYRTPTDIDSVESIEVGQVKHIFVDKEKTVYLKFIPSVTGVYSFESLSSSDTYGYIFDRDKDELARNDDGGEDSNFKVECTLKKGKTYFLGARYYESYMSGSFNVLLTLVEADCDHENTYTAEATIPEICGEIGYTEGVYCNDCRKWVSGHEEIKIPHTDEDGDTVCDVCEKSVSDILPGEEKIITVPDIESSVRLTVVTSQTDSYVFKMLSNNGALILFDEDDNRIASAYRYGVDDYEKAPLYYNLERGKTYYLEIYNRYDEESEITISFDYNNIESISFTPESPFSLIEGADSISKWDDEHEDWWNYYYAPYIFRNGNKLVVTYKDGTEEVFENHGDTEDDIGFRSDDNVIYTYSLETEIPQSYENQLSAGEHMMKVSYGGKTCEVPVTIVPDTLEYITFTPVEPFMIMEKTGGRWTGFYDEDDEYVGEWYRYRIPSIFREGNCFTFHYSDERADVNYYCSENDEGEKYYSFDTKTANLWEFDFDEIAELEQSYYNQLQPGEHSFTVRVRGRIVEVPFTIVAAHVHDIDIEDAVEPTCEKPGFTEGSHCRECGEVIIAREKIEALGHDYKSVVTAPTCTEEGYTTYTCTRCGDTYKTDITDANGHNAGQTVIENTVAATCTADGSHEEVTYCTVCSTELSREKKTDAKLGHKFVTYTESKEATCLTNAEETAKCERCDVTDTREVAGSALGHAYKSVVTAPTCTEEGFTTYTCTRCGDTYKTDITDANGHNAGQTVIENTVAATCTADGSHDEVTYCTICKAETSRVTKTDAKLGHSFTAYTSNNDADCTNDGTKTAKCSRCDVTDTVKDEGSKLGHDYKSVVTAPTCTEEGYTTYTCSRCNDTYVSDKTEAKGHTSGEAVTENTVAAACTTDGSHDEVTYCTICKAETSRVTKTDAKLGHKFVTYTESKEATCLTNTEETAKCERCDVTDTREVAGSALGHDYVAVVTNPTCTEEGFTTYTCTRCGDTYKTDITDANGHNAGQTVIENAVAATCTANGSHDEVTYCTVCSTELSREKKTDTKLGHSFTAYKESRAATCLENAEETAKCDRCDVTDTRTVENSALGHAYKSVVTAPTCTEDGYTTYTCSRCNDTYTADITTKLGHTEVTDKAVSATCTAAGKTEGKHCSACGEVLKAQTVVKATGHTTDNGTVTKKVTCTVNGTKTYKCTTCDEVLKTETIKATGHKEVTLKAVKATASKTGLTEGKKCSVCGKTLVVQQKTLAQVTNLKVTKAAKTSIKLSWTKIAGAKYYKVEQSTDGKTWKKVKTVSTNSATISALKTGKKYQYRVTALDSTKKISGKASAVLKTGTLTSAPTVTLKSSKSKIATASWKKVTGASKYVVYKSTDGKKWTKVTTTAKLSYTLTKLTGGKKVYVKVTAVNAYSKESAASTVKSVTVKK